MSQGIPAVVTPELIRAVAPFNPQLALILVKDQPMMYTNSYEVRAEFVADSFGVPVEAAFRNRVFNDVWIQRVEYTIHRPNLRSSAAVWAWSDEYVKRNPYVDVYGHIDAEDKWDFTNQPVPIETIFAPAGVESPHGFMGYRGVVIPKNGSPWMQLTLRRHLEEDEIPYIVRIIFSVLELKGCRFGSVSRLEAFAQLKAMGCCSHVPEVG